MFDTIHTPKTFAIGGDMPVNRIGYGAMRLTGQPGNFGPFPDWDAGVALLRTAHDLGVTFFDSARSYGPEWSDKILGEALGDTDAIFATKGGVDKPAPDRITVDGSPDRRSPRRPEYAHSPRKPPRHCCAWRPVACGRVRFRALAERQRPDPAPPRSRSPNRLPP